MYLTMMEPHTYPLPNETISDDLNLHNFLAEFDLEYDDALDPTSNKVFSDERHDVEENEDEINVEPTPVTYSKPQAQHSPCARNSSVSLTSCLGFKSTQSGFRKCSIGSLLGSSLQIESVTSIGSLATINPTSSCDMNESFHAPPSLNRQVTPPPTIPAPKPFSHRRVSSRTRKRKAKDSELFPETKENNSSISKINSCRVPPPRSVVLTPPQKEKKTSDVDVELPDDSKNKAAKQIFSPSKSKKSSKKKRARRTDPKIKEYVVKRDLDVLLGRGGCSNHHPGNTAYRQHILSLQKKYKALSREEKTAFSKEVLRWLHDHGGRFLKRDERGGPWYIVTDGTARQKVSQALREDHTPEGGALKKARTNSSKKPEKCAGGPFKTRCIYVL